MKRSGKLATIYIVRVAFLSASLTVFKLALSFIPNVEVVTVLVLSYASALGAVYAIPATLIFCAVEVAIYGAGSWVLLYFLYWPLLALLGSLLKGRRVWAAVLIGVFGSVLFGFLSACADTVFVAANLAPSGLWRYLTLYYVRGLYFDLTHVASSLVTIAVLYVPVVGVLRRAAPDAYTKNVISRKAVSLGGEYKREEREKNMQSARNSSKKADGEC